MSNNNQYRRGGTQSRKNNEESKHHQLINSSKDAKKEENLCLTMVAGDECPLEFREPYDGELFDVQEAQLFGNFTLIERVYPNNSN